MRTKEQWARVKDISQNKMLWGQLRGQDRARELSWLMISKLSKLHLLSIGRQAQATPAFSSDLPASASQAEITDMLYHGQHELTLCTSASCSDNTIAEE